MNMFGRTAKKGSDGYPEDSWLALSGIQHYDFCARQWALIHIEQLWDDNYLTAVGSIEHKCAHDYQASETRGSVLILRDLWVFSRNLGISGACDVVEFHQDPHGVSLSGREGTWKPYPIEYKHGKPKITDADRLQLCAEAMCLEEMLSCDIPEGALFYQQTKRRETVIFGEVLRAQVISDFAAMHDLFEKNYTPKARKTKSCDACSLQDFCLPEIGEHSSVEVYMQSFIGKGSNEATA